MQNQLHPYGILSIMLSFSIGIYDFITKNVSIFPLSFTDICTGLVCAFSLVYIIYQIKYLHLKIKEKKGSKL